MNPDSTKVASDPTSEGQPKKKKDKSRDRSLADSVESGEASVQIAADPDTTGETSGVAEQPPPKKSRHPAWNVVELKATISSLTKEVESLKAALEKAQRIRRKDPPIPPASSSDEENASFADAFDYNVDPRNNESSPTTGRKQPPTPFNTVLGVGRRRES